MTKSSTQLTEKDVINIIRKENEEMYKCFNQLTKDLDSLKKGQERIERVLLGDKEYEDKGMVSLVNMNYEYVKKNIDSDHVRRTNEAALHYEVWEKEKKWNIIDEMIDKYKALRWLTALIVGSGIISVANVITIILKAIGVSS